MAGLMKPLSSVALALALMPIESAKPIPQKADLDIQTAAQQLTGKDSRTWTFERIEVEMGGKGRCISGETWSFSTDHKVEIKLCENKQLVTKTLDWSLTKEGHLDTVVTVGETSYSLTFRRKGSATLMSLRSLPKDHTTPRLTKEFLLEKAE